jgi:hypothetical protein
MSREFSPADPWSPTDEFIPASVRFEWDQRRAQERKKALEKYGSDALLPGGRPSFDILDFAINEIVGLDRYGEMIENRFAHDDELVTLGKILRHISNSISPVMIKNRQRLLNLGLLGTTERER